jgi:hypothetical protein
MVKRVRELAFGIPGLIAWQWSEGRRLARHVQGRPSVDGISTPLRGSR